MKILLFSNDLMPFEGLPTSGGGLRAYQLYAALKGEGHEVIASMPGFTFLARKFASQIKEEQKRWFWTFSTQEKLIEAVKPDAVIFTSNWDHYALTKKPDVPLVIDLHGSRLIETSLFGAPASAERKVEVLGLADKLICAGVRQRDYFTGFLVQAGLMPSSADHIGYVPVSLSPDLPKRLTSSKESPYIVSGGGWFPWQNQSKAVELVANACSKFDRGTFSVFGSPHSKQAVTDAEQKILRTYENLKNTASENSRVTLSDYISRDELLKEYLSADVALELMDYNLERELAFTTRTIEYLWAGLPVIYNNYGEIGEHISEYDAGWSISGDQLPGVLEEIFTEPEVLKQKSVNAQRLVRDRFTWDKTVKPLTDFLANPVLRKELSNNYFELRPRPSYCSPTSSTKFVPHTAAAIRQNFTFPANGITAVETRVSGRRVIAKVLGANKEVLQKKEFRNLKRQKIRLDMPFTKRVRGGDSGELVLQFFPPGDAEVEKVCDIVYPLVSEEGVAIYLVPQEEALRYQLHKGVRRAAELIKNREWSRLSRAISRRAPDIIKQILRTSND